MRLLKIKARKVTLLSVLLGLFFLVGLSLILAGPVRNATSNTTPEDDLPDIFNPRVVRPSSLVDADGDKIDDQLADLMAGKNTTDFALCEGGENVKVFICVDKQPNDALIEKLRGFGAEILTVYKDLIYAVYAILPLDQVSMVAADKDVTFVEKDYESTALLDTSTINMGARGSSYVWDAVPAIKGNSSYSIAIVDTGVDSSHPDLATNFLYFRDFTGSGYPNGSTGYDRGHHGTHCASIAAGTGVADTDPQMVNETISGVFYSKTDADTYIYEWFEVKDNIAAPSTTVRLDWDTSGSGSAYFGIQNSNGVLIADEGPYSTTPYTHNLGNLAAGAYRVKIAGATSSTYYKNYTCTIQHESNYALGGDSAGTPVYSGVAPQSKIVSLKVLNDAGSGSTQWILDALTWILNNGQNPAYNITTVSMSLGYSYGTVVPTVDTAVDNLVGAGFICVVAAGNSGTVYKIGSPATAQKCITVGAVNDAFEVTCYSSNGDNTYYKPDVVAPGGTFAPSGTGSIGNEIVAADSNWGEMGSYWSDYVADDYTSMCGTSMACPHIAGLAQLVIDAIIQTDGSWTWSQANALRVKQVICMGTWEVNAGETYNGYDGDGIPQNPTLNRIGRDNVEGYGMARADAVIQSITHPTTINLASEPFYLDRREGSHGGDPKVVLFAFDAEVGKTYSFSLDVPATGDFDLVIYDDDYDASTGRPVVNTSSTNFGLGVDESLVFTALEGGTYYWSIRAAEGYGTCRISTLGFIPTVPSAPQNLQAIPGTGKVTLTWLAPASDGGSAITGYKIYRGTSAGAETILTTESIVLTYTDTGLTNGQIYYYKVAAVNGVGDGINATVSATPALVPTTPQNLQATAGASQIMLTWQAPASDGGSAITGYKIYRGTSAGAATYLTTVGNVLNYTDTGLTGGQTYYYKVTAVNVIGESAQLSEVSATVPPETGPGVPGYPIIFVGLIGAATLGVLCRRRLPAKKARLT